MDCIDLRPICKANRWRYRLEESFKAEKDPAERAQVGWYIEILCKYGLIYPWGEEDLPVFTSGSITRGKLARLGLKRHQSGDGEAVFRFHRSRLDEVAEIVKPRKRHPPSTPPSPEASAEGLRILAERREHPAQAPDSGQSGG